jgi:hypothetical protein
MMSCSAGHGASFHSPSGQYANTCHGIGDDALADR